jgi:antitoxin CptB
MTQCGAAAEARDIRLRRLRLRSWRRGMREMDLLLGAFADAELSALSDDSLDVYERMLSENDQDLYLWVCRGHGAPPEILDMVRRVGAFHGVA